MVLRQLNIALRAALGFALIAVLVALLGVFALGQMSSIRDSEVAVQTQWLPSIRGGDEIREWMLRIRTISCAWPWTRTRRTLRCIAGRWTRATRSWAKNRCLRKTRRDA